MEIDNIQVNFSETALLMMNIVIGFIMFGVALHLKIEDFKRTFLNIATPNLARKFHCE